ncbi:MAG: hypothetical protein JO029_10125 [Candidatus Eremiobacteraeota bacterium]|nr:hypothetical protein [Candidatus Eremiobacteraeota bacterium]MBV8283758.1 hypothetical protein [Candidatus Eremiobacteraeota bacterium]MBV8333682.1 hypothetical protein [Candidatus Eremiobacteraeota bacterium]MBV8434623.1 hypothetical protein [Candidatus Eremiobacteraeota bacterium]MBV8584253.1 hypothetical protein [Candidatus Eremiobacteraeota bacterium]
MDSKSKYAEGRLVRSVDEVTIRFKDGTERKWTRKGSSTWPLTVEFAPGFIVVTDEHQSQWAYVSESISEVQSKVHAHRTW